MIYCGFAGCGKSWLAHHKEKFIDLDSSSFEKDWDKYIQSAVALSDNGYHVLVSCHDELRRLLLLRNIPYVLVLPRDECKEEYLERYRNRGSSEELIKKIDKNWEFYTMPQAKEHVVWMGKGQYISDLFY